MAREYGCRVSIKLGTPPVLFSLIATWIGALGWSCASPAAEPGAKPEWLGSRAGVSDEVLPPWTPLEASGDEVAAWGRTYGFSNSALPRSVVARECELLASRIRLAGTADGKELVWTGPDPKTVESNPQAVRLAARIDSDNIRCEGTVTIEYDGMVRSDLEIGPKQGAATLGQLVLEIPLHQEHAKYLHFWPGRWGSCFNSTALPEDGYQGPFKPFVWLGDERRGLAWFSESGRNFFNKEPGQVIQIKREGEVVLLRINLITEPHTIQQPLQYTFGFQATPVKPPRPDVWDDRICHMGAYGLEDRPYAAPTSIRYPAEGHVRLDQGTFECWVRPHFNPQPEVRPDDPGRGRFNRNLLDIDLPTGGHIGFYWNVDDRGMRLYFKQGNQYPLMLSARCLWQAGQWHHVAFAWGDTARVFVDGQKVAERDYRGTVSGELASGEILMSNQPSEMDVDELRISSVPRETFDLVNPPSNDEQTLLLDRFDEAPSPGADRTTMTSPDRGSGGLVRGCRSADGKFGQAISSGSKSGKGMTVLDRLAEFGVRTVCFHEHWTDIQSYPKTTHGAQLRKLVEACHERNIRLLLYIGYLMSDVAPEWDEYHEQCLVHPRQGAYKRKYVAGRDQTAYIVCFRSVWQDFIAHHLAELVEEYGIDGVYLDGTSEPWGCANREHGCGYVQPDGTIGATYPFFDTRSMMKRIYTIVRAHNPQAQVNVHQSTCMTIPTLAFATGYWDGEQLQSVARQGFAQDVLPLDAFRTEFMGHNWGVPAELLHYRGGPFERFEMVSTALLHDVLVRPSTMSDVEESSKLWNAMDSFGRSQATWLPYWENSDYVRTDAPGVQVSLYNRPGKGAVAVVANMGQKECSAEVALNLLALEQPADLTGWDILAEEEFPISAGRLKVSLKSLECVVVWLKPE